MIGITIVRLLLLGVIGYDCVAFYYYINSYKSSISSEFDTPEKDQSFTTRDFNGILTIVSILIYLMTVIMAGVSTNHQIFFAGVLIVLAIVQIVGSVFGRDFARRPASAPSSKDPKTRDLENQTVMLYNGYFYPYVASIAGSIVGMMSALILAFGVYSDLNSQRLPIGGRRR